MIHGSRVAFLDFKPRECVWESVCVTLTKNLLKVFQRIAFLQTKLRMNMIGW